MKKSVKIPSYEELTVKKTAGTELKPCPFCGSENSSTLIIGGLLRTQCNDCLVSGNLNNTEAEAITAWNTRQPDPDCSPAEVQFMKDIADLEEVNAGLVNFARKVIGSHCWEYDSMDGLDIQELAEVLGLLEQHTATVDDVDEESDFEVGDPIYKFSEILKEKV